MERGAWVSNNHEPHKATNVLSPFPVKVSHDLKLRYHSSDCWFLSLYFASPLKPKSDWLLISPYRITFESNVKVRRVMEMITNLRSS